MTTKNFDMIVEGAYYRRRDNKVVGPAIRRKTKEDDLYQWVVECYSYTHDGRYYPDNPTHRLDLIERVNQNGSTWYPPEEQQPDRLTTISENLRSLANKYVLKAVNEKDSRIFDIYRDMVNDIEDKFGGLINLKPEITRDIAIEKIADFFFKETDSQRAYIDSITKLRIKSIEVEGLTVVITLYRPGLLIGKKGARIQALSEHLGVFIKIVEAVDETVTDELLNKYPFYENY